MPARSQRPAWRSAGQMALARWTPGAEEALIQLGGARRPSLDAKDLAQPGKEAGGEVRPYRADRGPVRAQQTSRAGKTGRARHAGARAQPGPNRAGAGREEPNPAQNEDVPAKKARIAVFRPAGPSSDHITHMSAEDMDMPART
jgi:hypothetical protein